MNLIRKQAREISVFLILILVLEVIPINTFALTGGPSAPEYSSFEPVDAQNMVDLLTGDFTYNSLLLEVPGPEGGYPLSLSYHAGIKPEQEASWVGLGWTLNAGAINRYVNNYPDDNKKTNNTTHEYWDGGESEVFDFSAALSNLGIGKSVGVGFFVTKDTYKGYGYGVNIRARIGIKQGLGEITKLTPHGNTPFEVTGGMNFNFSAHSQYGHSVSAETSFALGIKGKNGNSIASVADFGNSQSQSSSSNNISIKDRYNDNAGYSYYRYYIDDVSSDYTWGSIYTKHGEKEIDGIFSENGLVRDGDTYLIPTFETGLAEATPQYEIGGSTLAKDSYIVTGEGIGGSITPFFDSNVQLYRRSKTEQGETWTNSSQSFVDNEVMTIGDAWSASDKIKTNIASFRFEGEYSNALVKNQVDPNYEDVKGFLENAQFGNSTSIGKNGKSKTFYDVSKEILPEDVQGYSYDQNTLASAKHVEWFSESDINYYLEHPSENTKAKKLQLMAPSLDRSSFIDGEYFNINDKIGGFVVTKENGVSYHYTQPVYNYSNYSKYEDRENKSYYENTTTEPFAYTWLLTAVTGANFVDKGNIGIIDDEDTGYWVKFDYGKWTDDYYWRTPNEGVNKDLNAQTDCFSYGKKQLYYLDAIKTRSHTALFIKSLRKDGKSVSSPTNGGFTVGADLPVSSLGLSEIYLFTNEQLEKTFQESGNPNLGTYQDLRSASSALQNSFRVNGEFGLVHQGKNLLDKEDLLQLNIDFSKYALKEVIFNYEEDKTKQLCQNTPNSLVVDYQNKSVVSSGWGKHTLKGVTIVGENGIQTYPSTTFEYNKNPVYNKEKYDLWGYYKSDFSQTDQFKEREPRYVTSGPQGSASNVDAWSLTGISNEYGGKLEIEYESDKYETSVFNPEVSFPVQTIEKTPTSGLLKMKVYDVKAFEEYSNLSEQCSVQGFYYTDIPDLEFVEFNENISINSINSQTGEVFFYNNGISNILGIVSSNDLISATVIMPNTAKYGGGIRVSKLSLNDNAGSVYSTKYLYKSGVTTYEPVSSNFFIHHIDALDNYDESFQKRYDESRKRSESLCINNVYKSIRYASFVPSPGVYYGQTTVTSESNHAGLITQGESKTIYEFVTPSQSDIDIDKIDYPNKPYNNIRISHSGNWDIDLVKIQNHSSRIGSLKEVTVKNMSGDKISNTQYTYLHDITDGVEKFGNQGRVDEFYTEARSTLDYNPEGKGQLRLVMGTQIINYPTTLLSTVSKNHVTGITSKSNNLAFDFLTGIPTSILSNDSFDNFFLEEKEFAHNIIPYQSIGSKADDWSYENNLTENVSSSIFKVKPVNSSILLPSDLTKTGMVSNTVTPLDAGLLTKNGESYPTYIATTSAVWRPLESAVLQTDGTYNLSNYTPFNFNQSIAENGSSSWFLPQKIAEFDKYGHVLEEVDYNGVKSSVIMDPTKKYIIAAGSNVSLEEFGVSGAEFILLEGDIKKGLNEVNFNDGKVTTANAHSGVASLLTGTGEKGFSKKLKNEESVSRDYFAAVWVYLPGFSQDDENKDGVKLKAKVGGVPYEIEGVPIKQARNWHLIELEVLDVAVGKDVEIWCENDQYERAVYFDDFRVTSLASSVTTYSYDLLSGKLVSILDNDNFYTRFEYNDGGQLIKVYKEIVGPSEKLVTEQYINYETN